MPQALNGLTQMQTVFWDAQDRVKTDLTSIMKPHADYDFNGHAPDRLGIGTKFKVSAILNVQNVTVSGIGGLEWKVISGAAPLPVVDKNAGTIEAVANDPAGVKLKLVGVQGGLAGVTIVNEISIPVVEPSGAIAVKKRGYREVNAQDVFSPFMDLDYWLTPDNVSFVGIQWQEPGGEMAVVTDKMANVATWAQKNNRPDLLRHGGNPSTWMGVLKQDAQGRRRNWLDQTDKVGNTFGFENAPGTFKWKIKWAYKVPGGAAKVFKDDVEHLLTANLINNGRKVEVTIEKMGVSHTEQYDNPNLCVVCGTTHGATRSFVLMWHRCLACRAVYCPRHGTMLGGKRFFTDYTRNCGRLGCHGRTELLDMV